MKSVKLMWKYENVEGVFENGSDAPTLSTFNFQLSIFNSPTLLYEFRW